MHLGLGRGIVYARDNDTGPFRSAILDACLHCGAVDPQCEGTRALYMYELVNATPDREFYRGAIQKALPGHGDDWDAVQCFRLASYMAMDGDDRARQAMYEAFRPGPRMAELMGVDFVQMDGMEGFLFAAKSVGAMLAAGLTGVDEGYLYSHATETCGEDKTGKALRSAGESEPQIETYRLAAEAHREESQGDSRLNEVRGLTWPELKSRLPELAAFWLRLWGEHADSENLVLAAHDLLAAETPEDRLQYLRVFQRRAFPLEHSCLLRLAEHHDEKVAHAACIALANMADPAIRELAFRVSESCGVGREHSISLLCRNAAPGDDEIALCWFEKEEDPHVRHRLGRALRTFWEQHPNVSTEVRMLLSHYEKGPCSFCREGVLSRLLKLNALPDAVREECAFDSDDEIRELVKCQVL